MKSIFARHHRFPVITLSWLWLCAGFMIAVILLAISLRHYGHPELSQDTVPASLLDPGDPRILAGKSPVMPWSGWWWPFYVKSPPNLYNPQGPMDKYDQVSVAQGRPNPKTMDWERQNHYTDKADEDWFGHCNGWAAASVLEPQPEKEKVVSGVSFGIDDLMGLLSEWHWWDAALAFYGTRYQDEADDITDLYPYEFHGLVIDFIGERGLPLILDISGGTKEKDDPQVWNFPAFQYEFTYHPDPDDSEKTHVRCKLWFADSRPAGSSENKTFTLNYFYWIKGERSRPTSGEWETAKDGNWGSRGDSRKDHPDFAWYPVKATEHPVLDREQFLEIVGQGENR